MKLYVGNLTYSTMEDDLVNLFEQAGPVASCDIVLDKFTKKSRGFAFVEMSDREGGEKAIEQFNDYELDGRKLIVNEARPREPRGFGGPPGGGGGGYGGGGGGGYGGKRKSGKGSRRGSRNAKRERKAGW